MIFSASLIQIWNLLMDSPSVLKFIYYLSIFFFSLLKELWKSSSTFCSLLFMNFSFHVFNFQKLFSIEFLYEFNEHNIFSYFSKDISDSNFCWFVLTLALTISCLACFLFLCFFKAFFQLFGAHSCLLIFMSVLIESQWEVFNVWDEWSLFTLVSTVR